MEIKDHLQIGEIYREHGVKGFCKAYIYSATDDNLFEGETYTLELNGKIQKTKLLEISSLGRYFLLLFDIFNNPEQLAEWRKAGIWVPKSKLAREDEDEIYDYEWEGFTVFDTQKNEVGKVRQIAYTPLKQFAVMTELDVEILIPYNKDWIKKLDKKNKTVVLDLPEGLLEL